MQSAAIQRGESGRSPGSWPAARRLVSFAIRSTAAAALLCLGTVLTPRAAAADSQGELRIVNIYNFIRNSDYRVKDSEDVLFDCTKHQVELLRKFSLPATWALQYDALMNPRYQKLLKDELSPNDEIGAWWEIPKPLAEKAGINWRGEHDWDPAANVGFSPGYTPAERRKLVDVYMADFKAAFGHYPRTVGSWFIDEVTLSYLAEKYRIVASCNCKDQIGTDFYTLWGGYWNQAYYPSRDNAYMPAQTRAGQINVPVFRMLGSDPIYQHGTTPGLISLEPVYQAGGGGMPQWVDWFMGNLASAPSLAFAYAQAGQENSFGWEAMQQGLSYQIRLIAAMAGAGTLRVETLEESGEWFRQKFPVTPATAVVALNDWKGQGHKTVWYDSRFYRLNILWSKDAFFIRDIHCFDQDIVSPTHDIPLKATSLTYETLPVVDWAFWSDAGRNPAGLFPVRMSPDGGTSPLQPDGAPRVKELNATDLSIVQPLKDGGTLSIVCGVDQVAFGAMDRRGQPLNWAWNMVGGSQLKSLVKEVNVAGVVFHHAGVEYQLKLGSRAGSCQQLGDGSIQIRPDEAGKLVFKFDTASLAAVAGSRTSTLSKK